MQWITIVLCLFLCTTLTRGLCGEYRLHIDTLKLATRKHHLKHSSSPKIRYPLPKDKIYYNDCVFTHKYTIAQRLKKYPFSNAAKVLAVSYDGGPEPNYDININGDTINPLTNEKVVNFKRHGLLFKNDTLDYACSFELKQLTSKQVNRLTNVLFNTNIKIPNDSADPGHNCFNPRNAFIFFDKNGKVFDYIEICFECERTESKSGKIYLGPCNQKFDMVKKFFIDLGIKYGTITKDYLKQ